MNSTDLQGSVNGRSPPAEDATSPSQADDPAVQRRLYDVGVALGAGAGGYLCYMLWGIVLLSLAAGAAGGEILDVHSLVLNPVALFLGMVTGTALYLRHSRHDVSFLDVRLPSLHGAAYTLVGIVLLVGLNYVIQIVAGQLGVGTAEHSTRAAVESTDTVVLLYLVAASILFIGPGEELVFRNVVQKRLTDSFSPGWAIVVASVIFAVVHYQAYSTGTLSQMLVSLAVVFALSLLLGWIYHRTGNLVVVALIHGGYDALYYASIYAERVASVGG